MKLTAITLNNFRCFGPEPQTIPLEDGLAALLGSNGVGKSSVLAAMSKGIADLIVRQNLFWAA